MPGYTKGVGMGREIKRVALDFEWPINSMIWKGYHNPYQPLDCKACDQTGYSPSWHELSDDWYGFKRPNKRWCNNITQDEVDALRAAGRLSAFTGPVVSAAEVNKWSREGVGHDAINRMICVEQRANRLGLGEKHCRWCGGQGDIWPSPEFEGLLTEWQRTDPPDGPGYQLWSTTSEGHPMSPVFEMPQELARWLADNGASSMGSSTATYWEWLAFINGPGWCMDAVSDGNGLRTGINTVV